MKTNAYALYAANQPLKPYQFIRRTLRPHDVAIEIAYCGICHSDVHNVKGEWGTPQYPMVPGHEIVGTVMAIGEKVNKYRIGDKVGVGCLIDSCRVCVDCSVGEEQFCDNKILTYNSIDVTSGALNQGGYSDSIVVDEAFVLRIPDNLDLKGTAPLLCAGITTYSPLNHWQVNANSSIGIVGLGGLGHMGVKIAKALGANVTVFTHSAYKEVDAKRLGADGVIVTSIENAFQPYAKTFDLILDTVSAPHDPTPYLRTLKRDGTLVFVGLPSEQHPTPEIGELIFKRRSIAGSLIGGIAETQAMLDFCGQHNITADVELISADEINQAYERVINSDVKYRFVIDAATFKLSQRSDD